MALVTPKIVYQPIWKRGKEIGEHQRECASRYEPIRDLARRFKRPFSVLDVGANFGYFDFRLMEDFDCTCVMVDNKPVDSLIEMNGVEDRAIWINGQFPEIVFEALSRSEHFDIVLGLSVLHHFEDPERVFKALNRLGSHVFFEIPGKGDIGAAYRERHWGIQELFSGSPIASFPSHVSDSMRPMYHLENDPYLVEQSLDAADRDAPMYATYRIESDFEKCEIEIERGTRGVERRDFIPGMNLHNFRILGGGFPSDRFLVDSMEKYRSSHGDFHPWNFVLGYGVKPIDIE